MWRTLFKQFIVVKSLFQYHVDLDWLKYLDWDTLEECSSEYTFQGIRRIGDLLYKVQFADDRNLHALFPIEIQAVVDPIMNGRIGVYAALANHIFEQQKSGPDIMLGALCSILIYYGKPQWINPPPPAASPVRRLIAASGMNPPEVKYIFLDFARIVQRESSPDDLVWVFFSVLNCSPDRALSRLKVSIQYLQRQNLVAEARILARLFNEQVLKNMNIRVKYDLETITFGEINMLLEQTPDWVEDWRNQAIEKGIEKGMVQGIEKGMVQGIEKGMVQGIEKGMVQGIEKGMVQGIEKGMVQGIEKGMVQGIEKGMVQGIEKGMVQGIEKEREEALVRDRALVMSLVVRKFGIQANGNFSPLLEQIQEPDNLAAMAEWVFDCDHVEELLLRTKKLLNS